MLEFLCDVLLFFSIITDLLLTETFSDCCWAWRWK